VNGELVTPDTRYRESYIAALREFHAEDHNTDLDADALDEPRAFAAFVAELIAAALPETPRPQHWVPGTNLWYVVDDEYVGSLQIRHQLTPPLIIFGGNIGYEVRPSARRRGYATRMLALSLPIAHSLGIDRALLTCDHTNIASQKVIEANGGVPDTPTSLKRRYWIVTA
jgi:predicted acetyltransferase